MKERCEVSQEAFWQSTVELMKTTGHIMKKFPDCCRELLTMCREPVDTTAPDAN
jgi:hypothetical protein